MAAGPATMMEALSKVVSDISQAMVTPDADIQFLTQLQGVIVGRMRQGMGPGPTHGGPGMPGPGGMSPPSPAPAGPPPGAAGPPPQASPPMSGMPGPTGVTPLAATPSPDELRRVLAGNAGA